MDDKNCTMRKRLLYIMHVDWGWIKQRPHYIAEHLSKYYDILLVYPHSIENKDLMTYNKEIPVCFKPIYRIPHLRAKFNDILAIYYIKYLFWRFKPDIIWITAPTLLGWIPEHVASPIIYDCMDDAPNFSHDFRVRMEIITMERQLVELSSKIFVSSEHLMRVLTDRAAPSQGKMSLVRNAFGGKILSKSPLSGYNEFKKTYKICYIGTVSSWLDVESLDYCADRLNNIEFHIIGPESFKFGNLANINKKIFFHGPLDHDKLPSVVDDFDCMIMPFKVNELVASVDPVKLYEYINYNKPIISVYYEEIKRFQKFVYFYDGKDELLNMLNIFIKNGFEKKYTDEERAKFLEENSWDVRMRTIIRSLETIS